MNLDAEYKDFFEGLGDAGTYTYKFFDLFRVNLGDGEGDGGIKAGSISGTELIKLTGSVPPIFAGSGNAWAGDFFK